MERTFIVRCVPTDDTGDVLFGPFDTEAEAVAWMNGDLKQTVLYGPFDTQREAETVWTNGLEQTIDPVDFFEIVVETVNRPWSERSDA